MLGSLANKFQGAFCGSGVQEPVHQVSRTLVQAACENRNTLGANFSSKMRYGLFSPAGLSCLVKVATTLVYHVHTDFLKICHLAALCDIFFQKRVWAGPQLIA